VFEMLTLYGDVRSGSTRKVMWALEELATPYELRTIELARGGHRTADFLALNPNGKVPVIVDDGFVLWESDAILWYLADTRYGLAPSDWRDRALVQQWMSWSAYHLGDATYRARAMRMTARRTGVELDTARHAEAVAGAGPLLAILDRHLAGRRFVAGESLTIADLAIATNVGFGVEEGVAINGYAEVRNWFERMSSRPGRKRANGDVTT
jgi:glutathione S-transferase